MMSRRPLRVSCVACVARACRPVAVDVHLGQAARSAGPRPRQTPIQCDCALLTRAGACVVPCCECDFCAALCRLCCSVFGLERVVVERRYRPDAPAHCLGRLQPAPLLHLCGGTLGWRGGGGGLQAGAAAHGSRSIPRGACRSKGRGPWTCSAPSTSSAESLCCAARRCTATERSARASTPPPRAVVKCAHY